MLFHVTQVESNNNARKPFSVLCLLFTAKLHLFYVTFYAEPKFRMQFLSLRGKDFIFGIALTGKSFFCFVSKVSFWLLFQGKHLSCFLFFKGKTNLIAINVHLLHDEIK